MLPAISLTPVEDLFKPEAPIPKGTLKAQVIEHLKSAEFIGVSEDRLQISFNPPDGDDIILKVVDPHAATGHLVFQGEDQYNDWLSDSLYEPSQDEIEEAARRGSRTP